MKTLVSTVVLLLLAGSAVAQPLRVDALEKDFGEIGPFDQREMLFTLYNASDELIQLGMPRATCGCTATMLDNSTLHPGDSTQLSVIFRAAPGMVGKQRKSVVIYGRVGQEEQQLAVLRVHVEIATDVKYEPEMLRFSAVAGDTVTLHATLRSNTDTAVPLEHPSVIITAYVDSTEGNVYNIGHVAAQPFHDFSLELESRLLGAGETTRLTLTLYPRDKGQLNGTVRIPLTDTELRIPVVGTVIPRAE
ncbi:MAG: DUF1573 domain-containing protein [Bacteroidetes bacterium]|nr:DUF1573 domain-containing protein [Bacteroidota bacterium]